MDVVDDAGAKGADGVLEKAETASYFVQFAADGEGLFEWSMG